MLKDNQVLELPFTEARLNAYCDLVNGHVGLKPTRPTHVIGSGFSAVYEVDGRTNVSLEVSAVFVNRAPVIRTQIHCSASCVDLETADRFHKLYGDVVYAAKVFIEHLKELG